MWNGGVALLLICLWSPIALLAGHVGILVDRVETRTLAVAAGVFQAGIAAALAFVSSLPAILVLAFILGIGVAVSSAGRVRTRAAARRLANDRQGKRPRRVGARHRLRRRAGARGDRRRQRRHEVRDARGRRDVPRHRRRARAAARAAARRAGARRSKPGARDGDRLLFSERVLAITLGTGAIGLVFMSASIPGDFAYATHTLGVGKLAFGFVLTAWAVGMIVASNLLFAGSQPPRSRRQP